MFYVDLPQEIIPLKPPRIDIEDRIEVDGFSFTYTNLGFEKYLTIILPAEYIYKYAILTTRTLAVISSPRRKAFTENLEEETILYFT